MENLSEICEDICLKSVGSSVGMADRWAKEISIIQNKQVSSATRSALMIEVIAVGIHICMKRVLAEKQDLTYSEFHAAIYQHIFDSVKLVFHKDGDFTKEMSESANRGLTDIILKRINYFETTTEDPLPTLVKVAFVMDTDKIFTREIYDSIVQATINHFFNVELKSL